MTLKRYLLLPIAILFGLAINGYILVNTFFTSVQADTSDADTENQDEDCAQAEVVESENPNKHLFISCGGFIE